MVSLTTEAVRCADRGRWVLSALVGPSWRVHLVSRVLLRLAVHS